MSDLMINVFDSNAFSFVSLTDSINNQPFIPGRIGELGLFSETGIITTDVAIEAKDGYLALISPTRRGAPGETRPKLLRNARKLAASHFQIDDFINAEEVQNVREFGTPAQARTIETYLALRMSEVTPNFDATLEHQRVGAVKGIILDAAGNTVYNLFTEFGISAPADVSFDLTAAGKPRKQCAAIVRDIAKSLGGVAYSGVSALVGDTFWDTLITHPDVEKTYLYQEGQQLRSGIAYQTLTFGGITWENYKGYVPNNDGTGNVTPFIGANEARLFPLGVPNFFRTVFAPADYMETVNTVGLPRYAKAIPSDNNKGVRLEMQTNPLSYCTRPAALRKLVAST
ncbi:hypothetical protein M2322_004759 [Rhodoblastus acidophilus]|uniref:major capsid protein n=1 Tax=Rhodoblastus acidophilus TaxID=1074 RepID=UPI002224C064|nr:major capsid protein [Rhodoblastus acidophilus]MCW2319190.1 hypothetical protein [Rhodoblastus acidophilus]